MDESSLSNGGSRRLEALKFSLFEPRHAGRHESVIGVRPGAKRGFSATDLLVSLAVVSLLAAVVVPMVVRSKAKSRLELCHSNVKQVSRAVLEFAGEHDQTLPKMEGSPAPGGWWHYKEQVKGYLGLNGPPSMAEKVFACPDDRGYDDGMDKPQPFSRSKKHNYTSYVFNGVNLPGVPSIGGRTLASIKQPSRTLLVLEWTAHAPLSWHSSLTRRANTPFYNDAQSVVGFVDGHVAYVKIFYDGINAAYTRDPAPGYDYQYGGD
jgi:type II secretory pathway pseudopilin PulG